MALRMLFALPALAVALCALPAFAADTPRLKSDVAVNGALVTLGDLIDGAGEAAGVAVFRAPDLGTAGTVRVERILQAAEANGLNGIDTGGIASVSVSRLGRAVGEEEIARAIARQIVDDGRAEALGDIDVSLDRFSEPLVVEQSAMEAVSVDSLDYDVRTGRFVAVVKVADSRVTAAGLRLTGKAVEIVEVPVLARPVDRGEIIESRDIVVERMPRNSLRPDTITDISHLAGKSARRAMRAGSALTDDQLMEPILVQRGDMVTIVFQSPGLTLTTRGRALAAGAEGDFITVTNLQSKRTIEAEVTGPGVVSVMPQRVPVAALNSTIR